MSSLLKRPLRFGWVIKMEEKLHKKIQKLRNEFAEYIKGLDRQDLSQRRTQINNKFVDLLILNEILHKELKVV